MDKEKMKATLVTIIGFCVLLAAVLFMLGMIIGISLGICITL